MSHLPRLFRIVSVAAKYRLDQVSPYTARSLPLRWTLRLLGLPWSGSAVRQLPPPQRLRSALEELGPIYIKFGQLLSTRRDFLPIEIADALQGLQDKVPGFTSPTIEALVEQALGPDWQSHFAHIETQALASASIAQVHAARLSNGDEVVIKVL